MPSNECWTVRANQSLLARQTASGIRPSSALTIPSASPG